MQFNLLHELERITRILKTTLPKSPKISGDLTIRVIRRNPCNKNKPHPRFMVLHLTGRGIIFQRSKSKDRTNTLAFFNKRIYYYIGR